MPSVVFQTNGRNVLPDLTACRSTTRMFWSSVSITWPSLLTAKLSYVMSSIYKAKSSALFVSLSASCISWRARFTLNFKNDITWLFKGVYNCFIHGGPNLNFNKATLLISTLATSQTVGLLEWQTKTAKRFKYS